jgi:AcrR family transcriptional regulator
VVRDGRGHVAPPPGVGDERPSPVSGASEQRLRIVDGTLACIARWGLAKTTLDDVARASGYSRATVYRAFPGGKDALLQAVVDTEVSRLFSHLAVRMGEADGLEDVLVAGMTGAARSISRHAALGYLLEHEPEVVLPHLAFEHHDRLLAQLAQYGAPFLGRWLDHDEALRVAEWATRIVLSYLGCPAEGVDLTDPGDVRRLVRTFVLPGIRVLSADADDLAATRPARVAVRPSVPFPGPTSKGEAS